MASCEKCWSDAGGSAERYTELLAERAGKICSPEDMAGPDARICNDCGKKTIHQHTGCCVNVKCKPNLS